MKYKQVLSALMLGLLSSTSMANDISLSTFGAGGVLSHGNILSLSFFNYDIGDFRAAMKVSNTGEVAYIDQTGLSASVWSKSSNSYYYGLSNGGGETLDIAVDGKRVMVGNLIHRWQEDNYIPYWSLNVGTAMASNGQSAAGLVHGASSIPGNSIADFPYYTDFENGGINFKRPEYGSNMYTNKMKTSDGTYLEQLSNGFYVEVYIIDFDGAAEVMLTTLPKARESDYLYVHRDITLMDRAGRYVSQPFNVKYAVSLSNNGKTVLAYNEHESCPSYNNQPETGL